MLRINFETNLYISLTDLSYLEDKHMVLYFTSLEDENNLYIINIDEKNNGDLCKVPLSNCEQHCALLFSRQEKESSLNRIITGDEKRVSRK